ncbi:MAG: DUF47 family protein [Candidatus Bathyarchaeia archaeon]
MSELIKWLEKRKESKALAIIQRHLALTTSIVEDLERAIRAAVNNEETEMQLCVNRIISSEREADSLRRNVMDEVSRGDIPSTAREDIMHLVKRVDMVADWGRESTRVLSVLPMKSVPDTIKEAFAEMAKGVKECAFLLQKCVNKIMMKPEEALQAADSVEREEEKVDDLHEKARRLLAKETLPKSGIAVLIAQLFEALEMIADSCENACDQVRVIIVRR